MANHTAHLTERPVIDPASVEKKAKGIMDAFLKELGTIEEPKDFGLRREGLEHQVREPKQGESDPRFRRAIFANASNVKDDEFIMERKQW